MTITLNVSGLTESKLQSAATEAGLPVDKYVLQIVEQKLVTPHDEWLDLLNSGGFDAGVSLTDEQTRREVMYEDL